MADVTYRVAIELATHGNLASEVGRSVSKLDGLSGTLGRVGHEASTLAGSLAGAFEGAVEGAASLAATLGEVGAAAAVGAVTYGTLLLNKELESTQIALAAIFGANGITSSMPEGMSVAGDVMAQMRKDAAALPGEFKDLIGIFKTISVPGFQAGANIDQLRALSAQAMAVSQVMGLPMEQASREFAMLLEGRAGAHNVLGMRLAGLGGEKAEAFNKLPAAERLERVRAELEKFAPAIEAFSHSFEGLSSTLVDNAKRFLSLATSPLFERIKAALGEANSWFDSNEEKVNLWASLIGDRLGEAFDVGREKLRAWWPDIEAFAEHAYERIARIWDRVGPLVEHLADRAAKALGDDKTFDRLEQVGLLYAGLKGGGLLAGLMPSLGGIGDMDRLTKSSGIAGKIAPEGSAFDAMAGRFRDMFSGQFVAGEAGGLFELLADPVTLGAAAAAALLLVEGLVAAAGAIHALTDETSSFHYFAVAIWADIEERSGDTLDTLSQAWRELEPWILRAADSAGVDLLEAIRGLAAGAEAAAHIVEGAASIFAHAMDWLGIEGEQTGHARRRQGPPTRRAADSALHEALSTVRLGGGGGGGGVHVDRVEITVTSNQDPNRVARVIAGHLSDLARYRKSSPYVPNFSAAR
ncbi:MAG TPA: hypothetical protein VGG39_37790 [Polyangiaceae bacterium]|jgi:hypothetical protein